MAGQKAAPAEKVVEIAGMKFGISPIVGREGLRVLRRLSKSILPAIGGALLAVNAGKSREERAVALGRTLERFIPAVFADLTEDEMDALVDKLLATVVYLDGTSRQDVLPLLDLIFQGKTEALLRLLWASAAVSYADFFGGSLGAWARAVGAKMKEELRTKEEPSSSQTSQPTS